jgi:NitT/TauT family transport system ATP-binding protein
MAESAAPAPAPELLRLDKVSQIYGDEAHRFVAVKDVDLVLREGEYVCLVGPSGCGKSTLLRVVTGLQPPAEGHVLYRGQELVGVNPHSTIVFQTFALFPWLTVQNNVEVALKARGVGPEERRKRAVDLLDRVGLDGFESAYPRELSGGMRQKCGFARAMAVEPELLCLDEPFSALDVLSAESLRGELLELWTTGAIPTKAILMVTHNIEEAVFMADRIVIMDKDPGHVVSEQRIDLPHPRRRKDPAFLDLVDQLYASLAGKTEPEHIELGTAPGEPGKTRALPKVTSGQLAGLVERLAEEPDQKADMYELGDELHYTVEHLLPLTEALELLGFATVAQGDITLTVLGETFAEASILARKEIFATRIRRLPLVKWLLALLDRKNDHRLETDVLIAALGLDFPPEDAGHQLDTLINWGRYAEILAFDADAETIFLEPVSV